ncbi:hypothetical protein L2E82_33351 [Cichorium intybus]|uniref:Uncharacterized protein n=1 Tax=Cichorium intybus TaxID=13427 RepID=A0ACB9BK62_CICIN|nr:hypothetical protein L2E82_33351 [Cichorium intybus]
MNNHHAVVEEIGLRDLHPSDKDLSTSSCAGLSIDRIRGEGDATAWTQGVPDLNGHQQAATECKQSKGDGINSIELVARRAYGQKMRIPAAFATYDQCSQERDGSMSYNVQAAFLSEGFFRRPGHLPNIPEG